MSFTRINSQTVQRRTSSQGPAKIIITQGRNGRTQIALSAATRDHLAPTKSLRVSLLINHDTRELAVVRVQDGAGDADDFDVHGLSGSQPYVFGNNLDHQFGLKPGHYLAKLTRLPDADGAPAAIADLSHPVDVTRAPKGVKVHPVPPRPTTTDEERARIAVIDSIVNEGVTVIAGAPSDADQA